MTLTTSKAAGELTVITSKAGSCDAYRQHQYLAVIDEDRNVVLRRDWTWGCGKIRPNRPATDRTGNVFLRYNPGRYDGVIVLRAVGDRIVSFGTLPRGGSHYYGSGPVGYYAQTEDKAPHDGYLEIRQYSNDCMPDCAGGTTTSRLFVWNGSRYVRQGGIRVE